MDLTAAIALARSRLSEPLSVADLADEAGYSPFHFTRAFTARVGVSPAQYLTALRMHAAKDLLLADDRAVIDVATEVGFGSLSSFSRRFQTTVGVRPGALRQLADKVAHRPPRSFRLVAEHPACVTVKTVIPDGLLPDRDLSVWLGWYPKPAPIGVPRGGVLVEYPEPSLLPLSPGAPWLLGFAVAREADPRDQLVPARPVVAIHPSPLTAAGSVTLTFGAADPGGVPVLTALPSLCRG